jgi:hypothetical protein
VLPCSFLGDQLEGSSAIDIASPLEKQVDVGLWRRTKGEVVENGWTRYVLLIFWKASYLDQISSDSLSCGDVFNTAVSANVWYPHNKPLSWLGHVNHVFSCLQITSEFENYCTFSTHDWIQVKLVCVAVVQNLLLRIQVWEEIPCGYLFLRPETDFRIGVSSFRWPDCPTYWSRDPSGVQRLSTEEAERLGYPSIELTLLACGRQSSDGISAGLRQFHRGQGFEFDRNSEDRQDVAHHPREPPFRLGTEMALPFYNGEC